MLRISPRSTLNSEYLTIWLTVDLLLEPNVSIRLGTLSRHFQIDTILDLYQRAVLSNSSTIDFSEALQLLGLTNDTDAQGLLLLSIWNQSRTTRRANAQRSSASNSSSSNTPTTS
jgi:hypothetical protein